MRDEEKRFSFEFRNAIHFSLLFLLIFLSVLFFVFLVIRFLALVGYPLENFDFYSLLTTIILGCILIGTVTAFILMRKTMTKVNQVRKTIKKIADGEFDETIENNIIGPTYYDLIEEFNKMIVGLQSNAILKKDFISNFSHEFKTPIVSIKGYAELLYETPDLDVETRNAYLKIIIEEARRLSKLSAQTMLLSKLDSTGVLDHQEEYYLDDQLKECVLLLDPEMQQKNIDINLKLERVKYFANRDMLKEVWINLLSNAIKFSKTNGKINISLKVLNSEALVSIADNGEGMSNEVAEHIFDRYYQADSSHKSKGIGLGLAISKRIVELLNGCIKVVSQEEVGSVFTVSLPLKK